MKQKPKYLAPKAASGLKLTKTHIILMCVVAVLLILLIVMLVKIFAKEDAAPEITVPTTEAFVETTVATEPTTEPTVETDPEMLPEMAELYAENPDIIGWVTIEGTHIDYPVMFTPDDEYKYLYKNFKGKYDVNGLPFMDDSCSMSPESDNLVIHGHNMLSEEMFHDLLEYEDEEFWEEHPIIEFKTLYETRTYEIIGAFRDRVYKNYEDVFKFYQFIDYETEEEFNEAIAYYKENTPYDMNVEVEYGDRFITLVTCAYHTEYGRFVVVARDITEEIAEAQAAE